MLNAVIRRCRAIAVDERGVTALEYGVLAVAILAAVAAFATTLSGQFTAIGTAISAKITAATS